MKWWNWIKNFFTTNPEDGVVVSDEEMEEIDISSFESQDTSDTNQPEMMSRRAFLRRAASSAAAIAIGSQWPFDLLAGEDVIVVTVKSGDPHRSSLAAIVEHYCNKKAFARYYGGSYINALKGLARFNGITNKRLTVTNGQKIKIPRVLTRRDVRKEATKKKENKKEERGTRSRSSSRTSSRGWQSPFGGRKKPVVHLCFQGTPQNPRDLRARICPFDLFTARRSRGRPHSALDCYCSIGTPLYPIKSGVVVGAGRKYISGTGYKKFYRGNGKTVKIQTIDGYVYMYLHMSRVDVRIGQKVNHTTQVGLSGISGNASGANPHVHIHLKKKGTLTDPLKFMPFLR